MIINLLFYLLDLSNYETSFIITRVVLYFLILSDATYIFHFLGNKLLAIRLFHFD